MMRPKKRPLLMKATLLLDLAGHAAMGVAVGLAFAFIVTHIAASDIATLINHSATPAANLLTFVGTCATTFGIGATLTGLVIALTEDHDTGGRK